MGAQKNIEVAGLGVEVERALHAKRENDPERIVLVPWLLNASHATTSLIARVETKGGKEAMEPKPKWRRASALARRHAIPAPAVERSTQTTLPTNRSTEASSPMSLGGLLHGANRDPNGERNTRACP